MQLALWSRALVIDLRSRKPWWAGVDNYVRRAFDAPFPEGCKHIKERDQSPDDRARAG